VRGPFPFRRSRCAGACFLTLERPGYLERPRDSPVPVVTHAVASVVILAAFRRVPMVPVPLPMGPPPVPVPPHSTPDLGSRWSLTRALHGFLLGHTSPLAFLLPRVFFIRRVLQDQDSKSVSSRNVSPCLEVSSCRARIGPVLVPRGSSPGDPGLPVCHVVRNHFGVRREVGGPAESRESCEPSESIPVSGRLIFLLVPGPSSISCSPSPPEHRVGFPRGVVLVRRARDSGCRPLRLTSHRIQTLSSADGVDTCACSGRNVPRNQIPYRSEAISS
jgi:hypothetical protein